MTRYLGAKSGRPRAPRAHRVAAKVPPRKEQAACCVAERDKLGRLPIGYCGPDCLRRPDVWADAG